MKVLIIEDETISAQRLERMLHKYDPTIEVLAQIPSVKGANEWFKSNNCEILDLIFMDIHLEDDDAFQIIRDNDLLKPIIFTTAYDAYMMQAFKTNSVDYLLKPIDPVELHLALDKFKKLESAKKPEIDILVAMADLVEQSRTVAYKERFMVSIGPRLRSIETSTIAYFYFQAKGTFLKTFDGHDLAVEYSLDKLESILNPKTFFRINRSLVVSHDCIKTVHSISGSRIKLDLLPVSDLDAYVSGDRLTNFKIWLGK